MVCAILHLSKREARGPGDQGREVSAMKCHAMQYCGVLHSLKPYDWPSSDHRRVWRFAAYADGTFWRFFKTVKDWRAAVSHSYTPPVRGPFADATDRAVQWSEFDGRMALDRVCGEYGNKL